MKIIEKLTHLPSISNAVFTIGNFDGIHLGHQKILTEVQRLAQEEKATSVVMTYRNHPSELFCPESPTPKLLTLVQKIEIFKQMGIDVLIAVEFTQKLSNYSAEEFLELIKEKIDFSYLVLGKGASLGKNQEGKEDMLKLLGKKHNYKLQIVDKLQHEKTIISSTLIRKLVSDGDLNKANQLLGRPFTIQATVMTGESRGRLMGFPTANMELTDLCHPPSGVYTVQVYLEGHSYQGVANLGIAPTFDERKKPLLEVHLIDFQGNLIGKTLEVAFLQYIRKEKKFSSKEALQEQIQKDISFAQSLNN